MPKEIDDVSVCGENWYGITQVHDILEQLQQTRLWHEASGSVDQDVLAVLTLAAGNACELKRHLIDLQIKLLTIL